ncbi:MAG: hypothetical protein ABMB14_29255, partial [Myxococcota bacterium]
MTGIPTGWLLARLSFAGDPGPASVIAALDLPPGVELTATANADGWRFVVEAGRTRTLDVPRPATDADQAAILALVESLIDDLAIPERAATDAPPTPAPPPAPTASAPAAPTVGGTPAIGGG